jgi:hypothetical protein
MVERGCIIGSALHLITEGLPQRMPSDVLFYALTAGTTEGISILPGSTIFENEDDRAVDPKPDLIEARE